MIGLAVGAGLGVASSVLGKKGAKKAANAQMQATQQGINTVSASRDSMNQLLSPYSNAGKEAINPLMGALGIGGQTDNYQNPLLAQIQDQTVQQMQNQAAATGRNSPADMANVVAQGLLQPAYQMQQDRIGNLQNLFGAGSSIAGTQAGMDMTAAGNIAQLQAGQGQAAGQAAAAPYLAGQGMLNSVAGFAGQGGFNGMSGLFGGGNTASTMSGGRTTPVFDPSVRSPLAVNVTPSGSSSHPFNMVGYARSGGKW